jgi:hypothetical protein
MLSSNPNVIKSTIIKLNDNSKSSELVLIDNDIKLNDNLKSSELVLIDNDIKLNDNSKSSELVLIDNDIKEIKPTKNKKKYIPIALKTSVWNKYIGEEIGKTKCLCCNDRDITQLHFDCGHIIAEVNGGKMHIDNLRPICGRCNKSMGIKNMNEFSKMFI